MSRKKRKQKSVPLEEQPVDDFDVWLWQAIERRRKQDDSYPDQDAVFAMEEPLTLLVGASRVFCDLALGAVSGGNRIPELDTVGLLALSQVIRHEADRINRLYHGKRADDM